MNTNKWCQGDSARGVWSEFENIVFVNIGRYLESNLEEYDTNRLCDVFCSVVKHATAPYSTIQLPEDAVLRPKSIQQIAAKLNHYQSEKLLFEQLLQ